MLLELKVKNFVIIEQAHISFKSGFNVLSGETGSGKSILLKSLAVLMGSPSSSDFIGPYANEAQVEGLFDITERKDVQNRLSEWGLCEEDSTLIVRRLLGKKNRVFINGSLVTLSELKTLITPILEIAGSYAVPLIEMTGQHETKQLLSTGYHRFLLDLCANINSILEDYQKKFKVRESLIKDIETLRSKCLERNHQLDFLKFQLSELEQFNLDPQKDSTLQERLLKLKNQRKHQELLNEINTELSEKDYNVGAQLHHIIKKAKNLLSQDSQFEPLIEPLVDRVSDKKFGNSQNPC